MRKISFNADWVFNKVGSQDKKNICLPYDAMMYESRSADAQSGSAGGYFFGGKYAYKKTFKPDKADGKILIIEFEGVYGECFVYLNGKRICESVCGYSSFYIDISTEVKFDAENKLEVIVNNDKIINSRWYSGSGIYRNVNLYSGGAVRILPDTLKIATPEVDKDVCKIEVEMSITSDITDTKTLLITTEIYDKDDRIVHIEETPFTVFGIESAVARQRLYLHNAELWSPENPYLYDCRVKVTDKDGNILDEISSYFGLRKITIDPFNGLRINGTTIKLRGACIHHDNGVIGANEYYDACVRRVRILKNAGFNAVRISHHPCSKDMLDACDRLGMLVWDETFDMWQEHKNKYDFAMYFDDEWQKVIDGTVKKDFNHPCVFAYCIGNEIPEIVKPEGIRISRMLSERLRTLDSSRLITNAINGMCAATGKIIPLLVEMGLVTKEQVASITGNPDSDSASVFNIILQTVANGGDINDAMTSIASNMGRVMEHPSIGEKLAEPLSHLDVCGYNYMKSRYAVDARDYPHKILVGSETMPPDIDILWESVKRIPQLIGDFTWTGWDYIGEAGVGHTNYEGKSEFSVAYPGYLAYCGDIDITGYRRPLSYLREIVYGLRTQPYISVQNPAYFSLNAKCTSWAEPETVESWTWRDYEGKAIRVIVYSCDEEVELFVNGESVGKKQVVRNRATFETVYNPGEVTAIGYNCGKTGQGFSVKTATNNVKMQINLSKQKIRTESELCFIEIQLIDENGTKYMGGDIETKISVSGCAYLLGSGSGNPISKENFFDATHKTFNGRLLAIVRGRKKGNADITIECGNEKIVKQIEII